MSGTTRRQWLLGAGGLALLGGGYMGLRFRGAVAAAERRVSGRSRAISTPFGQLEYAAQGAGPPLLMIHGTGGGFDQGLRFASALGGKGYRVVAPSRFGYLRSDFPAEPTLENQAEAFVWLLDALGIERIAVIGGSAGALSAAMFAQRYPERCTALILLVPAANLTGADPVAMSRLQERAVRMLLGSDFLYWTMRHGYPEWMIGTLLATDPALLAKVDAAERRRAYAILDDMMPVCARVDGMLNDARQAGQPSALDFSQVRAPLLVISAEDDRFGTAATARTIAAMVPGAEMVILPDGGHIWLGHDDALAARMHMFLRARATGRVR